jgi:hypothetical protein
MSGTWRWRERLSLKRRLIWNMTEMEAVSETSGDFKPVDGDGGGIWKVGWYETWRWRSLKRRLIWNLLMETEAVCETSVDMKPVDGDGGGIRNVGWYETWRRRSLKRRLIWNLLMEAEAVSETSVDMKHGGSGLWNVGWYDTPDAAISPVTSEHSKHWKPGISRYSIHVEGDSVGKGNILAGDTIGHCEKFIWTCVWWRVHFTFSIPCIIIQLLQFEPTNALSFVKITTTLQHTSCYMFQASLAQLQGAHN